MTEEIKEILEFLEDDNRERPFGISKYDLKVLKDYITNLQQENEKLKYNARGQVNDYFKDKYADEVLKNAELTDYKSRCEKTIEYIMSALITEWDIKNDGYVSGSDLPVDAIIPILNILNGSVENETK